MEVLTNMADNIWKVVVQPGDQVTEGQDVVILELMKMKIPISAEVSRIVDEVIVHEGDFVNDVDVVIKLK